MTVGSLLAADLGRKILKYLFKFEAQVGFKSP